MGRKIGYARVSTESQTTDSQQDVLRDEGCEVIFADEGCSGASTSRPQLDACLGNLEAGDTLVVFKIDRLGRSLAHLVTLLAELGGRGVDFVSVSDGIRTDTSHGRLLFGILGSLAEFERELIRERVNAGLESAKRRGVRLGRKPKLSHAQLVHAREQIDSGDKSVSQLASLFNVDRTTLWRGLRDFPAA